MQHQLNEHERKIKSIEQGQKLFREAVNGKLETIMAKLNKPILTDRQMIGILLSLAVYLVISVTYVNKIDSRSQRNFEDIQKREIADEKMLNILIDIQKKVAKMEGQKEGENKNN